MHEFKQTLRNTILALAQRYDFEAGHSLQDERLALRLFDETAHVGLHRLGRHPEGGHADSPQDHNESQDVVILSGSTTQRRSRRDASDREASLWEKSPSSDAEMLRSAQHDILDANCSPRGLLSYAALLHDIGYVEGYEAHHKTAFRLILAQPIPGLSPRDQTLVAHIARYHRGGTPDPSKHPAFAALPVEDRTLVEQLGAILRFADGLDRSHTDAVQDLHCELDGNRLIVALLPGVGDEAERWAGQKKARWFETVYGVQVVLR